jgi:thioredoxin-like negative regulator of GroEL
VTFVGWTVIAIAWATSVWREYHRLPMVGSEQDTAVESLLARAQQEYLTGDWFETETLLQQILKDDQDDVDARLMLATLYRHTGRLEEADVCLGQLERMEQAGKWSLEISRERNLLADLGSKSETDRNGCSVRHSETDR